MSADKQSFSDRVFEAFESDEAGRVAAVLGVLLNDRASAIAARVLSEQGQTTEQLKAIAWAKNKACYTAPEILAHEVFIPLSKTLLTAEILAAFEAELS